MKKFTIFISLLTLILPALVAAAPSPESRANEMINQVKQQKSMTAIVDFIHWPTSYTEMDDSAKKALNVNSAEDLKNHTKTFMTDPGAAMETVMKRQMGEANLPPEQMAMMESMMAAQIQKAKSKMDASFKKFVDSKHEIKSSDIQGKTATVVVESTYDGKTESNDLEMKMIDNQWWITNNDMLGNKVGE